jgi:hypothetical protein
MTHGEGKESYTKNSTFQTSAIDAFLPDLNGALENMMVSSQETSVVLW